MKTMALNEAIFLRGEYGFKFNLGRKAYKYIGLVTDATSEGLYSVYVVKDENGNYAALSSKIYGNEKVTFN